MRVVEGFTINNCFRGVRVIAVLNELNQGSRIPPYEQFAQLAEKMRVYGKAGHDFVFSVLSVTYSAIVIARGLNRNIGCVSRLQTAQLGQVKQCPSRLSSGFTGGSFFFSAAPPMEALVGSVQDVEFVIQQDTVVTDGGVPRHVDQNGGELSDAAFSGILTQEKFDVAPSANYPLGYFSCSHRTEC